MKRHSFIFNFKSAVPRALFFIFLTLASLFILDRLTFEIFFPFYDQWLRVGSSLKSNEILVVGSSHIEADLDVKELEVKSQKSVGLFSVPGAGLIPRYYAITERLKQTGVSKPKLIILEVSKMIFNPVRYQDNISSYLLPYRNKGFYEDYLKAVNAHDIFWPRALQTFSLNGTLGKFTEPGNIARFFLEHLLPIDTYLKFRERLNGPITACKVGGQAVDPRIADWESFRKKNRFNNQVDPKRIENLDKIISLAQQNNIHVLLLVPPFFKFADEYPSDGYEKIFEILKSRVGPGVNYLEPTVPNDSCLFADDGHLTREGREIFTSAVLNSGLL